MPIDIETFDRNSSFEETATNAERIVSFLIENDDQAFQRDEIAEGVGIDPNTASSVLSRLKERGLVRHKPPYWAIGDPERVRAALDLERDIQQLNERLGPESMEEWRNAGSRSDNN